MGQLETLSSRINPKPYSAARFNEKGCLPVWGGDALCTHPSRNKEKPYHVAKSRWKFCGENFGKILDSCVFLVVNSTNSSSLKKLAKCFSDITQLEEGKNRKKKEEKEACSKYTWKFL
jgi:hypothetical protein